MENRISNWKVWNIITLWLLKINNNFVFSMLLKIDHFGHVILLIGSLEFFGVKNCFGCSFVVLNNILFFLGFKHLIIRLIELVFSSFLVFGNFIHVTNVCVETVLDFVGHADFIDVQSILAFF
jgi:hypothetical protein